MKLLTLRVNNVPTFALSVKEFFNICLRYKEVVPVIWGLSLLRSNAATNNLAEIKAFMLNGSHRLNVHDKAGLKLSLPVSVPQLGLRLYLNIRKEMDLNLPRFSTVLTDNLIT